RATGASDQLISLVRSEVLPVVHVVHVAEHGRARRQVRRIQEQHVKGVIARRWRVNGCATLKDTGGVLRIVQADQRSLIVQRLTPAFYVTQEVVYSAIGSKVLR